MLIVQCLLQGVHVIQSTRAFRMHAETTYGKFPTSAKADCAGPVRWCCCHPSSNPPCSKVNTLHLDPLAPHLLASSCSDGSVKIWDVRSMATHCSSSSSTSSSKGSKSPKPLCTVSHAQSSQAAYWSPDGSQRLLSISFDDTLKIWAPPAAAAGGGSKGSSGGDWQQQVGCGWGTREGQRHALQC
jgi:WD40 repeat protein